MPLQEVSVMPVKGVLLEQSKTGPSNDMTRSLKKWEAHLNRKAMAISGHSQFAACEIVALQCVGGSEPFKGADPTTGRVAAPLAACKQAASPLLWLANQQGASSLHSHQQQVLLPCPTNILTQHLSSCRPSKFGKAAFPPLSPHCAAAARPLCWAAVASTQRCSL